MQAHILTKIGFGDFLAKLKEQYAIFGPVFIWNGPEFRFGPINSVDDLRLDYDTTILPPHKKYFHPPRQILFRYAGAADIADEGEKEFPRQLLFGVHPCDVNAILSYDRVFLDTYPDPDYRARRENTVIVALNCTTPCRHCFCSSLNTGPGVDQGFDLAITDLGEQFLVEVGSPTGQELARDLPPATDEDLMAKNRALRAAQEKIHRHIDPSHLGEFLYQNLDHLKWDEEAERCLACGSCTNVCPTCFCFYLKDSPDLTLTSGEHPRVWDTCMSIQFSRVALDHHFRPGRKERLRHRIMHKLVNQELQFGALGCVGCGRCYTYCPVFIDIVDIVNTMKADPRPAKAVKLYVPPAKKVCPDKDPWAPQKAVLKAVHSQTGDTATYAFSFVDPVVQADYTYSPGTFNMIGLFGIGEAPISISSAAINQGFFEHTIRAVGNVTNALARLQVGDVVGIRGPYGTGWPMEEMQGQDVLVIAGGIGLAPLRPVIKHIQASREQYGRLEILAGARTPRDMLFHQEWAEWRSIPNTQVLRCVDCCPDNVDWPEDLGVVTALFQKMASTPTGTVVLTCGPDIMMKFVVQDLMQRGFRPEQIFVSLERRMSCGIKKCGNCQIGSVFVCQDGPVFRYADIQDLSESVF